MSSDGKRPYGVVVADPPWTYTFSTRTSEVAGTGWRGDAGNHYKTMTLDQIKALPVQDWASPDSVLWLWAVNPMLPAAFDVMQAWGYTYKTTLTWAKTGKNGKPAFGMGYWLRGSSEHVLLGVRGKVKPQVRNACSWFASPRMEHSRKPDHVLDLAERYSPGPYLEMFARRSRDGWDAWGDEIGDAA